MDLSKTMISFAEADTRVRGAAQADIPLAERLIRAGSDELETVLRRKVVTRGTITEHHSFYRGTCELWLNEFPALVITSIHEDSDRSYPASTLLVSGTDYLVDSTSGCVTRIEGDSQTAWLTGLEAVKIVYTAGYSQADVPYDLKALAEELFELQWKGAILGTSGRASVSDDMGTMSLYGPAELTSHMLKRAARHEKPLRRNATFSRSSTA